jgi:hypothetical protein
MVLSQFFRKKSVDKFRNIFSISERKRNGILYLDIDAKNYNFCKKIAI